MKFLKFVMILSLSFTSGLSAECSLCIAQNPENFCHYRYVTCDNGQGAFYVWNGSSYGSMIQCTAKQAAAGKCPNPKCKHSFLFHQNDSNGFPVQTVPMTCGKGATACPTTAPN